MQKRGIVLLIWEYGDTHYIYRKDLTLTHTSCTPSISGALPPNPQRGCQFSRSKRTFFSPEFKNPKSLITICDHGRRKVWTNWHTHRFNEVHYQCVSYIPVRKRWIVLLIWKYRETHCIYRKDLTLTHTSCTPSVSAALPLNPECGCQFLRAKRTSFPPKFENPKALIPICYNGCQKVWTNWQTHTDLTWCTNSVLATSTGRREE